MERGRPSTEEILALLPGLAPYGREAARLWLGRGEPGVGDSSVGGPLLWPADEEWPVCPVREEDGPHEGDGVVMVPVAQFHAGDVPGPWWPEGVDLLQVLWCPIEHWDPPAPQADCAPVVELRWRRAAELLGRPLAEAPEPPEFHEPEYLPEPCVLTVEQLVDFPYREELPSELRPALEQLVRETGPGGKDVITRVPGWKLGGWPTWHLNHPHTPACESCGSTMTLLLTIASDDVSGIVVGRWGDLRIFACPADRGHPFAADLH